jgi:hypothetical protein
MSNECQLCSVGCQLGYFEHRPFSKGEDNAAEAKMLFSSYLTQTLEQASTKSLRLPNKEKDINRQRWAGGGRAMSPKE